MDPAGSKGLIYMPGATFPTSSGCSARYGRMMRRGFLLIVLSVLACGGPAVGQPTPLLETSAPATSVAESVESTSAEGPALSQGNGKEVTPEPSTAMPAPTETPSPDPSLSTATTVSPTSTPTPGPEPTSYQTEASAIKPEAITGPVVLVGGAAFTVELAITSKERIQGLSGRPALTPGAGMLFVYEQEGIYRFWMKEMQFHLDIVWIGPDCTVVDVTVNAPSPEPGQTLAQLPRFGPGFPAQYALEINAGEAAIMGIGPGAQVEFAGDLGGRYGC